MNHSEAIESKAAEGYLLGDLPQAERDAFEEHYFDCRVCTDTIRAGAAMFAAGREVAKSPKSNVIWFPVKWFNARAVAAALAVVVGIQGYVMSRPLPLVQAMAPDIFITGTMRAGESNRPPIDFKNTQGAKVSVALLPDSVSPSYRLEVRDSSGKSLFVDQETDEQVRTGDELHWLLRPLPAGRHELVIEGVRKDGNHFPIARDVIVVQ
jgi:Putative zinc-finger